jgi:hypothetical protein
MTSPPGGGQGARVTKDEDEAGYARPDSRGRLSPHKLCLSGRGAVPTQSLARVRARDRGETPWGGG